MRLLYAIILLSLLITAPLTTAGADSVLLREEFGDLANWESLKFPKIDRMSTYRPEPQDNGESFVRAESDSSASCMVFKGEYDVYEYPRLRWRWKVSNVYEKGNAASKSGDDYPMRIYINFKYDTKDPAVKKRLKYSLAKLLYGKYPPYRSLNYIWANRPHEERYIPNKYTSASIMIPLRAGDSKAGMWLVEEVDVLEDYRNAFGEDPPHMASLAFMNDSDNTGESSVSWLDWIEVFSPGSQGSDPSPRSQTPARPQTPANPR